MYKKDRILFDESGEARYKKLLFPLHKSDFNHWALLVIDFSDKIIKFYDSLYDEIPSTLFGEIKSYIYVSYIQQCPTLDSEEYMKDWNEIDFGSLDVKVTPKQSGVDCGFFVMEIAKYIAMDWEITVNKPNKNDMEKIRERCVWELKNLKLLNI